MSASAGDYRVRWTVEVRGQDEEGEWTTLATATARTPEEAASHLGDSIAEDVDEAIARASLLRGALRDALIQAHIGGRVT